MQFQSTALQKVARLETTLKNSPPMRAGERSDGVAVLQGALIDLGHSMPRSTYRTGAPDGIYGRETVDAVRAFQQKHKLSIDGSVGRETLTRLDQEHARKMNVKKSVPAPRIPAPPPVYRIIGQARF